MPHHSHRLFLPQSAAAVLFGALGARGAPVACGGGAVACCLGLVSARELAGTVEGEESPSNEDVDVVAVSLQGPADATAAAAAEMLSVARRAAEEAASASAAAAAATGGGSTAVTSEEDAEPAAVGGLWTYCDERNARRGPFPWPQVLRWSRRGFWPPGFPLRDVVSGGILPSALAVAAMGYLFPAVAEAVASQQAAAAQAQVQAQQQQQVIIKHQQQQQHYHQHQQQYQQPTAMATEAPPLAVPAQPRPSPVIRHLFAKEEEMTLASSSSSGKQQQHPQQPGRSRMNISDALSILGRSAVGGGGGASGCGSGGGSGRRRGGGGQQPTADPPPPPRASVPAAAYAPAVAAYRPPPSSSAAAASSGSGKNANANPSSSSSSSDPRSLAAALDAAVVSLSPAVASRLRAVHGDLWLDVLPEPLPWRTPEAVLSVLKSTWRSSFDNGYASSSSSSSHKARAAVAVEALPRSLRAARSGSGPAVSEAACALADLVRHFPGGSVGSASAAGNGSASSSEEATAVAAALARARAAAAAAASRAASAGWI